MHHLRMWLAAFPVGGVNAVPRGHAAIRALGALAFASLLSACAIDASDQQRLDRAGFLASDEAMPPDDAAPWAPQRLSDFWEDSHPARHGFAWYRLEADAPKTARGDFGFYLTETLSNAQLFVNGTFAGQSGDLAGETPKRWEAVQLFVVPRSMLRPGRNVFHLKVYVPAGSPGGIGPAILGPHEALYLRSLRDQVGHTIGPAVVSLTILLLGLIIFVLWLRARHDRNFLLFAVATGIWGAHTTLTLLPRAPLPSPHYEVVWNAMYVTWVAMLCIFCIRFARARWPAYERVAIGYAIASVPAMYAGNALGLLNPAASWVRLGAIGIAFVGVYALVENAIRTRDTLSWILLSTGAVAAVLGVHDWLAAQDPDTLRPLYLVPYLALFFIALIGWIIIDQFVRTLREYAQLNVELEKRVAEKSAALEVEAARQAEARREAESANLAKSRFLAAASHDLRQPLHALGLFASALDERARDPRSRELVGRINQSVGALESLFNQVLDVSRLDAGAVKAEPRPVALQPLFDRIANDLSSDAEEKGLALRFVPTARAAITDPVLLERVLRNLVANAIRYTARGGILVGVRPRGGRLAIEVRDSGIGIAPEEQGRVFEEFYQAGEPARDRQQGLGLGLAIVKRLCDLLGHELTLASRAGRGTVFRVGLVACEAPAEAFGHGPSPSPVSLAGVAVAVIDDERDVRDSMGAILSTWGCRVSLFASFEEARAVVGPGEAPALLIVDYRLQGNATGLDAARELERAWGGRTRVLIVSGESSAAELARIGASGYPLLHKPVAPAKLRSLVAHLVAPEASGSRSS